MRARHFLALLAAGLVGAVGVGCDGNDTTGPGGSGGGGSGGSGATGGSTTTTTTSGMMTTTTTTTGMEMGTSCANAIPITIYNAGDTIEFTQGELEPIDSKQLYYSFTATKGQAVFMFTDAKPNDDPFGDGYPDLVVTIFDEAGTKQISQNDDPIPRDTQDSSMYTVMPADGTYCLKVEEFCQELGASSPACNAEYFAGISSTLFGVALVDMDPAQDGNVAEPATDNDMPYAIADSEYVENQAGTGYYAISIQGTFKSQDDVDVYTFTLPDAIPVTQGRLTAFFNPFPVTEVGNGSDTATGKVWIQNMAGDRIAEVDGTNLDPIDGYPIEAPLTAGEQYELHVQSGGNPPAGGNSFYFVLHYRGGSNPVEAGDVDAMTNNNDLAKAEALEALMSGGNYPGSFVAGDITAGDVDYFDIGAKPNAATDLLYSTCSAWRIGSGLRNLKLTVYDKDTGMAITGATATETADGVATLGENGVALGGATNVVLKVEATQDPNVKGTYYQCGVVFIPPAP